MVGHAATLTRDANGRQIRPGDPDSGGATAAVYGLGVEPSIIRVAPFVWSNGARARGRRRKADTLHARHAHGAGGAPRLPRPAAGVRGDPERRGGRGAGRRDPVRQRRAGDAPVVPPLDAALPHHHRVRLGRRAAAAVDGAGRDPPFGRVLHHLRLRAQEHRVGLRGVRTGTRGPGDARRERQNRPVAHRGFAIGGVPRSVEAAEARTRLPGRHPLDQSAPGRSRRGPRSRTRQGRSSRTGSTSVSPPPRSPSGSTASRARCSRVGRRPERSPSRGSHKALRRRRGARPARPRGRRGRAPGGRRPLRLREDDAPPADRRA